MHPLGGLRRVVMDLRQAPTPLHLWTTSGDVVTDSYRGILLPFGLRVLEIGRWESKWYSRNSRRL